MNDGGTAMQVRVLGPIEADTGAPVALGGPTQRRIMAMLALDAGNVVSVDRLVDATWDGEDPPALAERNVRTYVHRLRVAFGPLATRIETVSPGYRLHLSDDELDFRHFDELTAVASRLADTGDVVAALDVIDEAGRLWRGRPFGEFADEPWAEAEAERLTEVRITLGERRGEMLLEAGRFSDAVSGLEELTRAVPLRERPRELLMRALYQSGRQVEALRAFQAYRSLLVEEIGVDPSDDLVALDRAIATGDTELRHPSTAPRSVGAYELHERIGEGAFAVIHRGTQPALDRDVAIKVIRAELANRPVFIRRFEAEAQMVARVEHPRIVPLYDYWREPDRAFLVMRWMTGGSLERNLDDGPWGLHRVVTMVEEIAGALAAAHSSGIVHRDVKPANILLDDDGRTFLADFGIALEADELARPELALSEGSPVYASPEQLRKEPLGPATDVHALAVVAFRSLTGHVPFPSGDRREVLRHQLTDAIPSVLLSRPELPAAVDDVLAIATAKAPEDRYPTPTAFAAALKAAADGTPRAQWPQMLPTRPRTNPYKGLRAFNESDAGDFYGRERLVDEMLAGMRDPDTGTLLAVVGPSGSGKSSVVRAALVPAVRSGCIDGSDDWFLTTMAPGTNPFEALETALLRVAVNPPASLLAQLKADPRGILRGVRRVLPDDESTMLVVIDQFEELFTAHSADSDVEGFLDALAVAVTEPGSPVRVVLTLRADFYDRPLRHPRFAALLKRSTVAVTPLAPDELEHAIVTPAAAVGVGFEPGLVAMIAADVTSQPGALPLLQYALTQAFDKAESDGIRIADYQAIGGLTGAISRQADDLWTTAAEAERLATRHLFGRLVSPGEGTEDTSRRARRSELGDDPATTAVIDLLGQARLLTFDRDVSTREPTVEVAHEALIREWPRLREWLDEDRDGLRIHRHLTTAATAWAERGRDAGDLYRGARLEMAEGWTTTTQPALNQVELDFMSSSTERRDAEDEVERHRVRRLRRLLVTTGVVAVVALIAGALALRQKQAADDAAASAERSAIEAADQATVAEHAQAEAVAAEAQGDLDRMLAVARTPNPNDPTVAILVALEAFAVSPDSASRDALHRALTVRPGWRGSLPSEPIGVQIIELTDGRSIVVNTATSIDVWDVVERRKVASWPFPAAAESLRFELRLDVAETRDTAIAIAMSPRLSTLIDLSTGESRVTFTHDVPATAAALSPDGDRVAFGFVDGSVDIWETGNDTAPSASLVRPATVGDLGWAPDGASVAIGTLDGGVAMWEPEAATPIWEISGVARATRTNGAFGLLFSTSGDRLVVSAPDSVTPQTRALRVLDASTGTDLIAPIADPDQRFSLRWRDDSEAVVMAAAAVGTVDAFDLDSGRQLGSLDSLTGTSGAVGVLGDVGLVLIEGPAGIDLISTDGSGPLSRQVPLSPEQADSVGPTHSLVAAFDEGTNRFVTTVFSGVPPQVVDLSQSDLEPIPYEPVDAGHATTVVDGQFGRFVLDESREGFLVRDGLDGEAMGPLIPIPEGFGGVALSPRGDRVMIVELATAADREGLRPVPVLYDVTTGQRIAKLEGVPQPFADVVFVASDFSTDGSLAMAWNGAGAAGFDADSGELVWATREFGYGLPGPADDWIGSANDRGDIYLRDPDSLEIVAGPLIGHTSNVLWVDLSPDHKRLATWARDKTVRVWDLETMSQFGRELPSARQGFHNWSSDGLTLFVPDTDGYVLWNYDTDTWAEIACEVAGRNLTQEEWDQFGPRTIDRRATCTQFPLD